jgi:hypothetical protein
MADPSDHSHPWYALKASDVAPEVWVVVALALLVPSIWSLRKTHAQEIYIVWYVFSFFFVLFLPLHVAALADPPILGETAEQLAIGAFRFLSDVRSEEILVAAIIWLAVAPQLVTYFLSGLSGSASAPRFVSQVVNFTFWMLVKFMAGLAGILSAFLLAEWSRGIQSSWLAISNSLLPLATAFLLLSVREIFKRAMDAPHKGSVLYRFRRVHEFFTRYSRLETSLTPPKVLNQIGFENAKHERPDGSK